MSPIPEPSSDKCRVCRGFEGVLHAMPETMYGTGELFDYFECFGCGALSIVDVPIDIGAHYGGSYYSMASAGRQSLRRSVRRSWDRLSAENTVRWGGRLDSVLNRVHTPPAILGWSVLRDVGFAGRILDVGCGSGLLLHRLADMGFSDLVGIDPFLAEPASTSGRVTLRREGIEETVGRYDLIMFNHSFEHVLDAGQTIAAARDRLSDQGRLLLRVPVAQSEAWRTYGVSWAQIDPPRHIVLHTEASIGHLADRNDLVLESVFYDSTPFQFWGSEQIQNGIPLQSRRSHAVDPDNSIVTREQMRHFVTRSADANERRDGDQAGFVLRRSN